MKKTIQNREFDAGNRDQMSAMNVNSTSLSWVETPLMDWYYRNARDLPWRHTHDPYAIWVSEIMLQQTRVETVIPYYNRFLEALPTVQKLARAPETLLLKLWEGLGYYSRVRNMQKAAQTVCEEYNGVFPRSPSVLQKLCGIGSYTAGAIASIAFGIPAPAVDGNVMRVLARLTCDRRNIFDPAVKKAFEQLLSPWVPQSDPGAYNQGLIELGALICLPGTGANCESCPLKGGCCAFRWGVTESVPAPKPPKSRKIENRTVFIFASDGHVIVEKRPDNGLLAGLYQLPNLIGHLNEDEALRYAISLGLDPVRIQSLPPSKHVFTHLEWHMIAYRLLLSDMSVCPESWLSVTEEQLKKEYALPTAFSAYLPHLRQSEKEKDEKN